MGILTIIRTYRKAREMTNKIQINAASQLQFGAFVQNQVIITIGGVEVSRPYYNYNANHISACVDSQNPNVAVIHFDGLSLSISNGEYNEFYFGGILQASPLALAQQVIADAVQYTP